jgi:uncharacterized protein with PIN domain
MLTAPIPEKGLPVFSADGDDTSLEAVELELALSIQDLSEHSFRDCVERAAEVIDGEILFELRVDFMPDYQKAAAIAFHRFGERHVFLALLNRDGDRLSLATQQMARDMAVFGVAQSFSDLSRLYESN